MLFRRRHGRARRGLGHGLHRRQCRRMMSSLGGMVSRRRPRLIGAPKFGWAFARRGAHLFRWRGTMHLDLIEPRSVLFRRLLLGGTQIRVVLPLSVSFRRRAWWSFLSFACSSICSGLGRGGCWCSTSDARGRRICVVLVWRTWQLSAGRWRNVVDERPYLGLAFGLSTIRRQRCLRTWSRHAVRRRWRAVGRMRSKRRPL